MHNLEHKLLILADTVEDRRMNHNAIAVVLRAIATESHNYYIPDPELPPEWREELG